MGTPVVALPRTLAGRYELERELGRGATAIVFAAFDQERRQKVAVKLLRPVLAESLAAGKFLREIRKAAELHHPGVVEVLDAGEDDGQPFCVLPLMEEGTLRQRLERERQLPIKEALRIGREIAEALAYCHARGVVHRDVKPENILFSGERARLSDFGIARALEQAIGDGTTTTTGLVRGTPAYMSPEQASADRECDGRSDVYSLGCVLYEMIAGMPAFMGPTAEAIIAQRFSHPPRDLTAYRPSVSPRIEAAIAMALELTPADRLTAAEFADVLTALEQGRSHPSLPAVERVVRQRGRAAQMRAMIAAGILVAAVALGAGSVRIWRAGGPGGSTLDTTRLVILPVVGPGDRDEAWQHEDLLQQALSQWRGIEVVDRFQVADAVRRAGGTVSSRAAVQVARSLGAGRYIRATLSPVGASLRAHVVLYDVTSGRSLYSSTGAIPGDLEGAAAAYAQMADTLLLRGSPSDSVPGRIFRSRSLPAVQAFGRAQLALDEWNLAGADSAFQSAISFDPDYAAASFWLAQVRAWRGQPPGAWAALTERAYALRERLSEREQHLLDALHLSAAGNFPGACEVYDRLRLRSDRDFSAWFGLAQCQFPNDKIVVPDSTSPSGWRFRSSAHSAMQAYSKAFEILPSVHRGYERGAFERLRRLLLASYEIFPGYAITDSTAFWGRPGWMGDTLVLVPYPARAVQDGDPRTIPPGFRVAISRRATEFRRIAAAWSTAFPGSAGAKHAVAIALELNSDPRALDTLRLARGLEPDPGRQVELAAAEALLMVKFYAPDNVNQLQRMRLLADSLLRRPRLSRVEEARALAPLAAIRGRCAQAEQLLRTEGPTSSIMGIPPAFITDANVMSTLLAMSCPVDGAAVREMWARIDRQWVGADENRRQQVVEMLLMRQVLLAPLLDRDVSAFVTALGRSDLAAAVRSVLRSDAHGAQAALQAADDKAGPTTPTPDMALARARLALLAGDSARAVRILDESLGAMRSYEPGGLAQPATAAALVPAMILRAELAAAARDRAAARRWTAAAQVLWDGADEALAGRIDRLTRSMQR